MEPELYYTAPSDEIFEEVKQACIAIRAAYPYSEEKVAELTRLTNIKDNFMYMVAKFDMINQLNLHLDISKNLL